MAKKKEAVKKAEPKSAPKKDTKKAPEKKKCGCSSPKR